MKASNEQLKCGCTVTQQKLGSTVWNRPVLCSFHAGAWQMAEALEAAHEELRALADYEGNPVDLKVLKQAEEVLRAAGI